MTVDNNYLLCVGDCGVLIEFYSFTKMLNNFLSLTALRFSYVLAKDPITSKNLKFVDRNLTY